MQAGGQEFESLHLHLRTPYAPQGLCPFGRVQARYKIKHLKTLMEASFRHVFKHLILHTYLENRILNRNELIIQLNIKTSEAIQAIVWKETNFLLGKSTIIKHRGKERESV